MQDFKFMMITNNPVEASELVKAGVDRLFVDLELTGKELRQGHRDTVISHHSIQDVEALSAVKQSAELLVRINPFDENSKAEIDAVIEAGADIVMLPMFRDQAQIDEVVRIIDGRALFCPLIETLDACAWFCSDEANLMGVDELYFGLNDLHLELNLRFMFASLLDSRVASAIAHAKDIGMPFGFGGIAPVDAGQLDGGSVAALHLELGSQRVILSRMFRPLLSENSTVFVEEVSRLRSVMETLEGDAIATSQLARQSRQMIHAIESDH